MRCHRPGRRHDTNHSFGRTDHRPSSGAISETFSSGPVDVETDTKTLPARIPQCILPCKSAETPADPSLTDLRSSDKVGNGITDDEAPSDDTLPSHNVL